ncbi:DegT/DnrJ/EryC1/StrS family aminotransferase [bacterium AH-315-E10]|nr:DegT/DnrJ/EryC1/StrS family aminotransferase [bacterium AH-315-E10]
MTTQVEHSELAVNGGTPVIETPFPSRGHLGQEEKDIVVKIFDDAIASGNAPGYNGQYETQYCEDFAAHMGGGFADGVNSGTNAVYVALKALNPEPYSEIIVGAVTDAGGMMPIVLLNCIPIVADAAPGGYNSGPEQIEPLITERTSIILIAHIGGEPTDIEGIIALAEKHNIQVVEDCAQAHGATINGKQVGSFGDISAMSTMFGKHHCTGGQGGVVFTKNEDLLINIRRAADRGKPFGQGTSNAVASLNNNLNDLGAAIGIEQLKKLSGIVKNRQQFAAEVAPQLNALASMTVPEIMDNATHSYWWWRLAVNVDHISCTKAEFCSALQAEGVCLSPSYMGALPHLMDWFTNRSVFGSSQLPWSSSEYKGDASQSFPTPNALHTMETQFNMTISESWTSEHADLLVKAFQKVDGAYSK